MNAQFLQKLVELTKSTIPDEMTRSQVTELGEQCADKATEYIQEKINRYDFILNDEARCAEIKAIDKDFHTALHHERALFKMILDSMLKRKEIYNQFKD